MEKILSFIIPAYNAQGYLGKCLESFLASGMMADIEVVVVNDGSSDSTPKIAQEYVDRYPGTYHLLTKTNGGHGSAINYGARKITGRYMKVIDADDWITSVNLSKIITYLKSSDAQVVLTPYHTVDMVTGERIYYQIYKETYGEICSLDDILLDWRSYEYAVSFHGIIYRTDFYKKRGIPLVEGVFYEDHEYAAIPFCKAEKICSLNIPLYEYLIGNSQQSVAVENQIKRLGHSEAVINHMLEYYTSQTDLRGAGKEFFYRKIEALILSYYRTACLVNPKRKEGCKRCEVENGKISRENPELWNRLKLKYRIFHMLSILGLGEQQYYVILNSKFYHRLRKKKRKSAG